jgi:hypothetical protein
LLQLEAAKEKVQMMEQEVIMVRYFPLPRIILISLLFTVYSLNVIAAAPQPGANSGPQYTEQSAAQPLNKTEALLQSASASQRGNEEPPARMLDNMILAHISHWVTEILGFGLVVATRNANSMGPQSKLLSGPQ